MVTSRTVKAEVHELIEALSYDELVAIKEFLCRLQATSNPIDRALLRASLREPEELSDSDLAAIQEAKDAVAAGDIMSHEELLRRLDVDVAG